MSMETKWLKENSNLRANMMCKRFHDKMKMDFLLPYIQVSAIKYY